MLTVQRSNRADLAGTPPGLGLYVCTDCRLLESSLCGRDLSECVSVVGRTGHQDFSAWYPHTILPRHLDEPPRLHTLGCLLKEVGRRDLVTVETRGFGRGNIRHSQCMCTHCSVYTERYGYCTITSNAIWACLSDVVILL